MEPVFGFSFSATVETWRSNMADYIEVVPRWVRPPSWTARYGNITRTSHKQNCSKPVSIVLTMSMSIKPLWTDFIRGSSDSRGNHALRSGMLNSICNHNHRPYMLFSSFGLSILNFFQKFSLPWALLVWETPVTPLLLPSLKSFLIWCIFTTAEDMVANIIYLFHYVKPKQAKH